jgi:hypothetical protein
MHRTKNPASHRCAGALITYGPQGLYQLFLASAASRYIELRRKITGYFEASTVTATGFVHVFIAFLLAIGNPAAGGTLCSGFNRTPAYMVLAIQHF